MSKLQRKAVQDTSAAQEAPNSTPQKSKPVPVSAGVHGEVASPARDLMAQLNYELAADYAKDGAGELSLNLEQTEKYPLKWTLLGLGLFCGLCWYGIISLIF